MGVARRIFAVAAAGMSLADCASSQGRVGTPTAAGIAAQTGRLSPTPTMVSPQAVGPLTVPLPTGVRMIRVTFLRESASVYQASITDQASIARVVGEVDALPVDAGETQGCFMSPVTMRLDFIAASGDAVYAEDSGCARATLTIHGTTGPRLDSSLTGDVEALVHVIFDDNGNPSVEPTPAASSS